MSEVEQVEAEEIKTPTAPEGIDPETGEVLEDDEQEGEPETEPPFEEEQIDHEARAKEIDKALEKEAKVHEKKLAGIYGDEWANRVMCPLCIGEGFLAPWAPGDLPQEQLDAMDALSGRYTPPELKEDTSYEMCDHCDGWGKTITGAKNPEHITKLCDGCGGNGFKPKTPTLPTYQIPTPATNGADLTPAAPVSYGAPGPADQWGRPAGHAHYGIEPQYVTA